MDIRTHLYSSTILGGTLYALTQSKQVAISSFLSGIFIDVDHIFDFLIFSKEKFSIKNFISWCDNGRWEKITVILHSYELYLVLGIITYYSPNNILIGILSGTGLHLMLDQIAGLQLMFAQIGTRKKFILSIWFYFLTYRIYVGFRKDYLRIDNLT